MTMVAEVDPKERPTVLAGLLGLRGRCPQDVAKAAGVPWPVAARLINGRTLAPTQETLDKVTAAVNKLLGTKYGPLEVFAMTRDRVTTNVRAIERGLRGGWAEGD